MGTLENTNTNMAAMGEARSPAGKPHRVRVRVLLPSLLLLPAPLSRPRRSLVRLAVKLATPKNAAQGQLAAHPPTWTNRGRARVSGLSSLGPSPQMPDHHHHHPSSRDSFFSIERLVFRRNVPTKTTGVPTD